MEKSLKLSNAKEIDTSMAKEYINKINEDDQWPEDNQTYIEVKPGKIIKIHYINSISNALIQNDTLKSSVPSKLSPEWFSSVENIAEAIEKNTEMFVQFEYLLRGTDPRDVRDGHIKLMSQLAQCTSTMWNGFSDYPTIIFTERSPLYNLAFVFWALYKDKDDGQKGVSKPIIMINNKKLKPLCKFFIDICRDAGLEVALAYTNRALDVEHLGKHFLWQHVYSEPDDNMGCTGVVVERADLDSAIDCFINSSVSAPWRFKKIYVQESIFEDFVDALRAREGGVGGADVVFLGDKTFLLEGQGGEEGKGGGKGLQLPASAFRSAREVIDLIDTPYLSLWAAETALSHEIALKSPSKTIWINDHASFYGPPRSALSVFKIQITVSIRCPDMKEILSKWSKLKTKERFDVIKTALTSSFCCDPSLKYSLPELKEYCADSLLEITDKTICCGIQNRIGLIRVDCKSININSLRVLLNGNGIYYYDFDYDFDEEEDRGYAKHNNMRELGIPVASYDDYAPLNDVPYPILVERLKVVRTNYGTIFAN